LPASQTIADSSPMSPCSRGVSMQGNIRSGSDVIREIGADEVSAAAAVTTDALLHDPGWLSVGPDRTGHRHLVALRYHRAALKVTQRHGGPIYGAYRDGALTGVAATFAAGLHPAPAWTFLRFVPPFLLAGPGPIVRGLRVSAIQDRGHPDDEHVYLWFLAVDPRAQRGGVGRALLARVFEEAKAPVYLDTANPADVPYYASAGFEEIGRAALPRGATLWFMKRP
jgi:ribosomal protein S18 acetylase RimI-like enzyme